MSVVSDTGVVIPTEEEILQRLIAAVRAAVDPALDLSADSPEGGILRALVPELRAAWEGLGETALAYSPGDAEGAALRALLAISGLTMIPARATAVNATVTLAAGTTLPAGTTRACVAGHPEISGVLRTAVSSTTAGAYPAVFDLEATGPTPVPAGTFTSILTPLGGWTAVTNAADGVLGRNAETESEARIRRNASTGRTGRGTTAAVRASVLALGTVSSAVVFENPTDLASADGVPPHSFEVLVDGVGGDANAVAQAILDASAGGYVPWGSDVGTATDATTGAAVAVHFTRAAQVPIHVAVTVRASSVTAAQVQAAVVAAGGALVAGADVIQLRIAGAVQALLGPDEYVSACYIGTAAAPTGTANIPIAARQRAAFDTARISVTLV